MSKSRLEKFLYALYSLDTSDLPNPLSRIEELYKCLVTGDEVPTFEPLSRVEKYLMAILGVYNVGELPNPLSRVEALLYKLATGDDNLDDVKSFLSEHEELLAEIIRNGGAGGNIDIEYVLYTLSTEHNTLYNTAEKPVKSAILKGNTGYRDIDTGEFLETFEEGRNLELVSVKMPVLTTTGKNLFDMSKLDSCITVDYSNKSFTTPTTSYNFNVLTGTIGASASQSQYMDKLIRLKPNTTYTYSIESIYVSNNLKKGLRIMLYDANGNKGRELMNVGYDGKTHTTFTTDETYLYAGLVVGGGDGSEITVTKLQLEESSVATPYKPFKSNILTTSEQVELRGIGEVKDELNLITGELTQRVGDVVLDGSEEGWTLESFLSNDDIVYFNLKDIENIKTNVTTPTVVNALTDKLKVSSYVREKSMKSESYFQAWTNHFIGVSRNKLITQDVNGFKQWLSDNNLRINHQLSENSVKTVDLSTVNQDGNNTKLSTFNDITHVTLSSEGLIPEAELEVATKNEEVLNTMSLEMDDISTTQNALKETSNTQSENVDATMIATTEIYEELI